MSDLTQIEALLHEYFRVLHEGDIEGSKKIFLPTCDLSAPQDDGGVTHYTYEQYHDLVAARTSPKANGYPRHGVIISIDQSSPRTAFAKVDCAVQPRYFIDYLTLIKVADDWKIAAKVFYVAKVEE